MKMSKDKHSPGPWRWDDGGNLYDADGKPVLEVWGGPYPGPGYVGRLIAAAPEMLALLREWVEMEAEGDTDTRSLARRSVRLIARIDGEAKP
jgi:hypothetical protein